MENGVFKTKLKLSERQETEVNAYFEQRGLKLVLIELEYN